jgi:hypothetical protein
VVCQDLDQQKLAILDYARRHRMPVADFVAVHGSAGSPAQREQLLGLIDILQPGDRLGRAAAEALQCGTTVKHIKSRMLVSLWRVGDLRRVRCRS